MDDPAAALSTLGAVARERLSGPAVGITGSVGKTTTKDLWALEEIRTDALEQKSNSRVVFVLPWLVLVAMTARSGAFREFYGTPLGVAVVMLGGLMSLVGVAMASRLASHVAEPRVFVKVRGAE